MPLPLLRWCLFSKHITTNNNIPNVQLPSHLQKESDSHLYLAFVKTIYCFCLFVIVCAIFFANHHFVLFLFFFSSFFSRPSLLLDSLWGCYRSFSFRIFFLSRKTYVNVLAPRNQIDGVLFEAAAAAAVGRSFSWVFFLHDLFLPLHGRAPSRPSVVDVLHICERVCIAMKSSISNLHNSAAQATAALLIDVNKPELNSLGAPSMQNKYAWYRHRHLTTSTLSIHSLYAQKRSVDQGPKSFGCND